MDIDEKLLEIRERVGKASPEPWRWGDDRLTCESGIVSGAETIPRTHKSVFVNSGRGSGEPSDEDRDFIIAARTDIPALLRLVDVLRRQRDDEVRSSYGHQAAKWGFGIERIGEFTEKRVAELNDQALRALTASVAAAGESGDASGQVRR